MLFAKKPSQRAGDPRFPVVFVMGLAHCGSTMLARLMNQHPAVLSVGELMRLGPAVGQDVTCTCGQRMSACPFWAPRVPLLRQATGLDWRRFGIETYTELAQGAGRAVAFDVSKTLVWRRTRWWRDRGEGYVFLVRDSRGSLASALRENRDLDHQLAKHAKWMKRLTDYAKRRKDRALVLHYEDLCREPERELRRLCEFLGLEFHAGMLRPADGVAHLVHASSSGYLKGVNAIRLDERWRRDLPEPTLAKIEATMAGLEVFRGRWTPAGEAPADRERAGA